MQIPCNQSPHLSIHITMADTLNQMSITSLLNPSATVESKEAIEPRDTAPVLTASFKPTNVWLPPMIAEPIDNVNSQVPYRLQASQESRAKAAHKKRSRTLSPPQLPSLRLSPPIPYRRRSHLGWNMGHYRVSENGRLYPSRVDVYNTSNRFDNPDEPRRTKSRTRPHFSNKAYTREQVDFCRYLKIDCDLSFEVVKILFKERFPDTPRESNQCFSSRYYRDNVVPRVDHNGSIMFDHKGRLLLEAVKVRDRNTPEGKAKGAPFTLIDKFPWRALTYDWVSKEHKAIARLLVDGIDPTDPQGKKAEWRRILREAEDHM